MTEFKPGDQVQGKDEISKKWLSGTYVSYYASRGLHVIDVKEWDEVAAFEQCRPHLSLEERIAELERKMSEIYKPKREGKSGADIIRELLAEDITLEALELAEKAGVTSDFARKVKAKFKKALK